MNRPRTARLTALLTPLAMMSLVFSAALSAALAQSPPVTPAPAEQTAPPTPSTTAPPAITPAPATPAPPTPPADPAPSAAAPAPPAATPPAAAQAPATPPADQKVQTADPFGEEVTLTAKKVVTLKGKADWESAFETVTTSLKTLNALLDKQGIKPAGPFLIVYTSTDDTGFTFQAQIPVEQDPKNLTKDMSIATSPAGKTLKFVHRGSYDNMDNTYEAITNHLDEKKLEAKDTFIEEYVTDPLKTSEDKLVINVFVPLK